MARRNAARLYSITLRASSRRVGSATLVRGQGFTLPLSADVSEYRRQPKVWDVKIVPGHAANVPPPPAPSLVSPRVSSALTGLVNRLDASRGEVERLEGPELEGWRKLAAGQAGHLAGRLASIFGGELETWLEFLTDPRRAGRAFDHLAELETAEAEAGEIEAGEIEAGPALAERAAASPRGEDADELDEDAQPFPFTTTPPKGEASSPTGPGASPAVTAKTQALDAFQASLVALQAGDEGTTMGQVLELAAAAGLEVPPTVRKIRRRAELAAELAALLAAKAAPPSPSASPSPAELEG